MSDSHEYYLAVLKASYDYQPQSDDEIAITEDQLLFLKERVDDDWWRVKVKGSSQSESSSEGLVPAAYVEQAEHTSKVKALYDYDAAADGELSVHEDEILLVFEDEDGWMLAQSQQEGGKAGFVPGNYVEPYEEQTTSAPHQIIIPPSPPRPVSTYVDPAVRVAAAKVAAADGIKTWSVSEVDKKGKKKKGTLGIGNGAVFFASESDKTPVQKWRTVDVQRISSEKAKHLNIDIGGTTPVILHFQAGSKDNVEEIISKLHSSKSLSAPQSVEDLDDDTSAQSSSNEAVRKKASVHFSTNTTVINPDNEDVDGSSEDEQPHTNGVNGDGKPTHSKDDGAGVALYDFTADGDDELSISEGEHLIILEKDGDEWWKCRNSSGREGVVPASYIELSTSATSVSAGSDLRVTPPPPSPPPEEEEDLEAKAEAERAAREEEKKKAAEQARKAEAQRRAREAAEAAEAERKRRKEARISSPASDQKKQPRPDSGIGRPSSEVSRPPPDRTRIWHDRSGQFRVEAAFLGFNNGKLRLHKVNGVIVEVPAEKMSLEDMKYVERLTSKKSRPPETKQMSEDDVPLAVTRAAQSTARSAPSKAAPKIDWFDFFLSAGCDLDDCTRYASSFEKDKLDETLLSDITDGVMRTLGVREGDIIRIKKAIEKRKPTDNLYKPSTYTQEQVRRDEELAKQLQAQETGGARAQAPNLFAGPGGTLKNQTRRGRPTPSKSMPPPSVDLNAISAISTSAEQIKRTSSPQVMTPTSTSAVSDTASGSRSNSTAPVTNRFDDDAWTNRPSSTKPLVGTPAPRAPSVPPVSAPLPASTTPAAAPTPTTAASPAPNVSTATTTAPALVSPSVSASMHSPSLAKTTEEDIFEKLARYGELRKQLATPVQPPPSTSPPVIVPPGYQTGLGMGSSPTPMGQLLQTNIVAQQPQPAPYNGPRGPFAPVPANQSLLQPLIPTQTGFAGMVPTRGPASVSPFMNNSSSSFLPSQPTGFAPAQPLMSQPTGMPLNGFNVMQTSSPIQPQFTGFNPSFAQSPFGNPTSPFGTHAPTPPSIPPLPSNSTATTSPANVFAQMKSGTFATDHNTNIQTPPVLTAQPTGWVPSYQGGYTNFQR